MFGKNYKCLICAKTVYPYELITLEKKYFHTFCFRCTHCNTTLKPSNYVPNNGKFYCKPHYRELFQLKSTINADDSNNSLSINLSEENLISNSSSIVQVTDRSIDLDLNEIVSIQQSEQSQLQQSEQSEQSEQLQQLQQSEQSQSQSQFLILILILVLILILIILIQILKKQSTSKIKFKIHMFQMKKK
eukprot:TRINITY_DN781_c1_g1_i2.p1 TRINITY_DN781_c1_g1~~TRINITY_DN781_c1_g1_i2.p1  ORF type:complete len:189 (+),score=31.88 TRINITY_DN781_c1_g1_i2:96-662(+)